MNDTMIQYFSDSLNLKLDLSKKKKEKSNTLECYWNSIVESRTVWKKKKKDWIYNDSYNRKKAFL